MLYLCTVNERRINLAQAQWPMCPSDRDNSLMRTPGFRKGEVANSPKRSHNTNNSKH